MSKLFFRSSFVLLAAALLVVSGFFMFAGTASAVTGVTVTDATGGSTISADTVGGTFTDLTGPVITENNVGQIGIGTIVLTAPSGFEFNTVQNVTATRVSAGSCSGTGNNVLKLNDSNSQTATPNSTTITFNVTQASAGNPSLCTATITFTNIQVRPTTGILPNSGNITHTGTSIIAGVDGTTNFGTLTEIVGAPSPTLSTITTTLGEVTTDGGLLAQITVTVKDQYGNLIVGLAASKVVLSASGTGNTLNQPSLPTDSNGQTFGSIASSKAEIKTITAVVDGVLLSAPAYITFIHGVFHHITITPIGPQSVEYGNTIAFSAQGYDINNNAIPGIVYTWSVVPGTGTGTVDSSGLFTATGVGTAVVRATSGVILGDSGTITIIPRPITVTADPKTKIYGQSDPSLTYQITSGSLAFSDAFTGEISRESGEDVGIYAIGQGTLALNSNYNLIFIEADFEITPAALTISATVDNKVYDGTTDATAHLTIEGLVDDDEITADYANADFDNKNVGTGKTVTVTGITIDGAKKDNYTFNDTATTTADILQFALIVTAVHDEKVYDGTTTSAGVPTFSPDLVGGDTPNFTQSFDNKNVDTGKILTPSGTVNDGNSNANYDVTFVPDNTGVITQKDLTVTVTGIDKVYDGTTDAAVTYGDDRVAGDVFTVSGTATFDTKDVGTGKTVSVVDISISGIDAGNYNLFNTTASTTADIMLRPIIVTADAKTKVYGQTDPELTYTASDDPTLYGDNFTGELTRDPGEDFGIYAIQQGTLALTSNYALTYVGADFTITKAMPVITWDNPDDITYPTPLSLTQLNAEADVPGSFVYTPDFGTVIPAGFHQELFVIFTPDDVVNYESATKSVYINVLKGTPVITWPDPAPVVAGTFLDGTQLNATADVPGSFTYDPPAGTQLITIGDHALSVDFTPNDDSYNSVSDDATINVFAAPIDYITIMASPMSLAFDQTSLITVTGYDQYDNVVTNDDSTMIVLSADGGGSLASTILILSEGVATTDLSKDSVGIVHVTASSDGLTPQSITVEFTETDISSPFVESHTPANGAENVPVNVHPVLVFSEPLDTAMVSSDNIQLRKYSDDSVISATVSPAEGDRQAIITPTSPLDFNTQYYFAVSAGVTDKVGNPLSPVLDSSTKDSHSFTTVADNTFLSVTGIFAIKTYAVADGTYENGWSWTFNVTVPTTETELQMKFDDWTTSLPNIIPAAGNIRYSSAQASNGPIEITVANTYGDPLHLASDLDSVSAGMQIQILVEARVPVGSAGGSYSTSYGIQSLPPTP